ncbi:putative agmatine deiminase [Gigantopelta aegis]|uniref:putative agmatine deiminase n=1 Tax=Gigantopelta aegis TaxID=1735272 RepID=UPI001B88A9DD|nr:putative agmatine deiminase [Gigantopelta aegis]XP_041375918.1 putative agmatine deiminase [Gigantopelta aegis]XP_041375919.1 putative agmatine deiminase [Gigantopelta aegis]XP_041375920.1 putative agmatine deiminase [Gigantopelta aegis]
MTDKHLIVVSIPGGEDASYYKKELPSIAEFVKELDVKTAETDDLIVVHEKNTKLLKGVTFTHAKCISVRQPLDLWMRDFTRVIPSLQVQFTYNPNYIKAKDASWVSKNFDKLLSEVATLASVDTTKNNIILDGGNVVDNDDDKAVITERLLADNRQITAVALQEQVELLLKKNVCLIPDPGDKTGHSDGMVSFIERDTLLLADYGNKDEYEKLECIIRSRFPDTKIVRLPCKDTGKTWKGISSAVGSYVNCLVTSDCVYIPRFGEDNEEVMSIIRSNTSKKVVSVDTGKLSHMGGSVRCMTWQIRSSHPIAKGLLQLASCEQH